MGLTKYHLPPPETFYSSQQQQHDKLQNQANKNASGSQKKVLQALPSSIGFNTSDPYEITHAQSLGIMRQMAALSRYAAEIFQDIHHLATESNRRVNHVQSRIENVSKHFSAKDRNEEEKIDQEIANTAEKLRGSLEIDHQEKEESQVHGLFQPFSRPQWLQRKYDLLEAPPDLSVLDEYWSEENRPCSKRFSNPQFFFDTWLENETARQELVQQAKKKKREERKKIKEEQKKAKQVKASGKRPSININSWGDNASNESTTYFDPSKAKVNIVNPLSGRRRSSLFDEAKTRKPQLGSFRDHLIEQQSTQEQESTTKSEESSAGGQQASKEESTGQESSSSPKQPPPAPSTASSTDIPPPPQSTSSGAAQSNTEDEKTQSNAEAEEAQSHAEEEEAPSRDRNKSIEQQAKKPVNNGGAGRGDVLADIRKGKPLKKPTDKDATQPGGGGGRGGLLADIRQGQPLKKTKKTSAPSADPSGGTSSGNHAGKSGAKPGGLLAEIHQGATLKSVPSKKKSGGSKTNATSGGGGIASQIQGAQLRKTGGAAGGGIAAILARRAQIAGTDDDEASESESD